MQITAAVTNKTTTTQSTTSPLVNSTLELIRKMHTLTDMPSLFATYTSSQYRKDAAMICEIVVWLRQGHKNLYKNVEKLLHASNTSLTQKILLDYTDNKTRKLLH